MIPKVINVYKKRGQTPFECIGKIKKNRPDLASLPMTYAGRLDPLAEGVLLILVGDECLRKEEYLNLPKEYEVDIFFGFATDTYDVMGEVTKVAKILNFSGPRTRGAEAVPDHEKFNIFATLNKIVNNFIGDIDQSYPPYSSRKVLGKPLFSWAREGRLDEIEIPTHDVFIENIEIVKEKEITGKVLFEKIKEDIAKVNGDFRQEEILRIWGNELKDKYGEKYPVFKLRVTCGSGAYMRSLAHELGQMMGLPSFALNIVRTKVGEYTIQK